MGLFQSASNALSLIVQTMWPVELTATATFRVTVVLVPAAAMGYIGSVSERGSFRQAGVVSICATEALPGADFVFASS